MKAAIPFLFLVLCGVAGGVVLPSALRVNYLAPPDAARFPARLLAVDGAADAGAPDLSWQVVAAASERGAAQTAFSVQVALDAAFAAVICDSGRVESNATLCVRACDEAGWARATPGAALYWRVAIAGSAGGALSAPVQGPSFVRGPAAVDFAARFVAPPRAAGFGPFRLRAVAPPPPAGHEVLRATAFVAAPGYFQLWSGGARVDAGREFGYWPEFNGRVYYEVYDLTALFAAPGAAQDGVAIGLRLGPGTYGYGQFAGTYNATGAPLLFELHVDIAAPRDGGGADRRAPVQARHLVLASRPRPAVAGEGAVPLDFHFHADTTVSVDWYNGESVDNTLSAAFDGWDTPTYNEAMAGGWSATAPYESLAGRAMQPPPLEPVSRIALLAPIAFFSPADGLPSGTFTWAFAQNFAGYLELDVPALGFANTSLRVFAGEETDGKGGVRNQLRCNMQLQWRLRGATAVETIAPTFIFWGAQYFGVSGWPANMAPPTLLSARGVATSSFSDASVALRLVFDGIAPSGEIARAFAAGRGADLAREHARSNAAGAGAGAGAVPAAPLLNASILAGVQHLTLWGQASNFQSLPSDCPNRGMHSLDQTRPPPTPTTNSPSSPQPGNHCAARMPSPSISPHRKKGVDGRRLCFGSAARDQLRRRGRVPQLDARHGGRPGAQCRQVPAAVRRRLEPDGANWRLAAALVGRGLGGGCWRGARAAAAPVRRHELCGAPLSEHARLLPLPAQPD